MWKVVERLLKGNLLAVGIMANSRPNLNMGPPFKKIKSSIVGIL